MKRFFKRIWHNLTWHPKQARVIQNGKPGWQVMCVDCCHEIMIPHLEKRCSWPESLAERGRKD